MNPIAAARSLTARTTSSELVIATETRNAGALTRKEASHCGNSVSPIVRLAWITSGSSWLDEVTAASALTSAASAWRARGYSSAPASVTRTPRAVRSSSGLPTRRSSASSRLVAAD